MIHFLGTGPQNRLSSEAPRLSPIMNQWSGGTVIGLGELQSSPAWQGLMNDSFWTLPLRTAWPSLIAIVSPGPATMRLMNLTSASLGASFGHGWPAPSSTPHWPLGPIPPGSPLAGPGGWKTTTSPTLGS